MNPSPDIVLMSPGKEEIHGGPDKVWIDNLRSNLELVLRKDFGSPVQSITPDNKDAAEAFANAVVLIALLHESYPASGKQSLAQPQRLQTRGLRP